MAYGNRGRGTSSRESLRRRMDMRTSSLGSPSTPFRVVGDLPTSQPMNRPLPPTAPRQLATAPQPDPQAIQQEALAELMRRRVAAMQMMQAQSQPQFQPTTITPYQLPAAPHHQWQPVSVTPFSAMGGM